MDVDIRRLGPAAQKQIADKLLAQHKSKYNNQPAMRGDIRFDSQKEARRYDELMLMLKAGKIRDLKLQPQFTLQESYTTPEGNRVRAIRYQADFSYKRRNDEKSDVVAKGCGIPFDWWDTVVEDVKSKATKTRVYEIKKKLMRERFGIEITEVE